MNINVVTNDYLLIWYLLYNTSISNEIHLIKQKLWREHRNEYKNLDEEQKIILNDMDNYIPDDDFIFNYISVTPEFKKIKYETNKNKLLFMQIFDSNKKKYLYELNKIIKTNINNPYKVCIIHPEFNTMSYDENSNIISIGKKILLKEKDSFLVLLFYKILSIEFSNYKNEDRHVIGAILELAIINELYSKISGNSKYNIGKKSYKPFKEKIYPYWLMYLGIPEEKFDERMKIDNIYFDKNKCYYDKKFNKFDIYTFTSYIISNLNFNRKPLYEEIETL